MTQLNRLNEEIQALRGLVSNMREELRRAMETIDTLSQLQETVTPVCLCVEARMPYRLDKSRCTLHGPATKTVTEADPQQFGDGYARARRPDEIAG